MLTLKAPPHCYYYAPSGKRYYSGEAGLVEDVAPNDVAALVAAGCFVERPWKHEAPPPPPEPPKPKEVAKIKMKGVPGMAYQPISGSAVRYHANRQGYFYAHPDHIPALINAGCTKEYEGW